MLPVTYLDQSIEVQHKKTYKKVRRGLKRAYQKTFSDKKGPTYLFHNQKKSPEKPRGSKEVPKTHWDQWTGPQSMKTHSDKEKGLKKHVRTHILT
jgi:hypothetical protein